MSAYTEISGLYDRVFDRFEGEDLISKSEVLQMIAAAPAADVEEVKRGAWQWKEFNCACSVCGKEGGKKCHYEDGTTEVYPYCPNCGAKIDDTKEGVK